MDCEPLRREQAAGGFHRTAFLGRCAVNNALSFPALARHLKQVGRLVGLGKIANQKPAHSAEATSLPGFVQQLAVSYVANGYFFYVLGRVPEKKNPASIDSKLVSRYGIDCSKYTRYRRKQAGRANIQYIRFRDTFVLIATHGEHEFFDEEGALVRDLRRVPLKVEGYSISSKQGRAVVRIEREEYRALKAYFLSLAVHRSADFLAGEFTAVSYEPYAAVRGQLLCIWRAVNRARKLAGFELVPKACVPAERRIYRPFGSLAEGQRVR